jgi:hypothetical protein
MGFHMDRSSYSQNLSELVETTTLRLVAHLHPLAMCINGSRESIATLASSAPLGLYCRAANGTYSMRRSVSGDLLTEFGLLNAMVDCGAVTR